jgi:putative addiction module antidote
MVLELKLRKIGNSIGVVLPKEALARLNAGDGDALYLTESTDGDFRVTATNPEFAQKMKVADRLSRRYRHALKELAK